MCAFEYVRTVGLISNTMISPTTRSHGKLEKSRSQDSMLIYVGVCKQVRTNRIFCRECGFYSGDLSVQWSRKSQFENDF